MKTLQKVLEEKDVEMKRLAQLVRAQESQLQQKPDPCTMDEHQLQRQLDMLCDIMDMKKKLSDAEDERHITATRMKVLQEEAISRQQHTTTLVSGFINGISFPFLSLRLPLFLHPMPSCSRLTPHKPPQPLLSSHFHLSLSNTKHFVSIMFINEPCKTQISSHPFIIACVYISNLHDENIHFVMPLYTPYSGDKLALEWQ